MDFFRAVAALVIAIAGASATAAAAGPAATDQQCLTCHAIPGFEMPLANGKKLSLHIDGATFAKSVHGPLGCTACHSDINLANHPPANLKIASQRAFALQRVQVCRTCHSAQFNDWSKSVHAALVRNGDQVAPICTSCHSPHAVMKGEASSFDTVPCKKCHGTIFTAYSESVHGLARGHGMTAAPLCFNCHGAHNVRVPTSGQGMRPVCLSCHTNALANHQSWLPNAALHFQVVACAACHSPKAHRAVDLILYNNATQKQVPEPVGVPRFESTADHGTGLDPQALIALLKALNRPGSAGKTSIEGRLVVQTATEAHEIAPASEAISKCATCHRASAAAFQSVSVSVAGPAGIPVMYRANPDVLKSVFSVQSVSGFYAIGGTRIGFLDILFILALLAGIGIPVAHVAANWWFKHFVNVKDRDHRQG